MTGFPEAIEIIDSHTEGEPTRVVIGGWPEIEGPTMAARRDRLARDQDHLRRAVVCEPRGHDAVVGALLTEPEDPDSVAGVIFFNNAGTLGMCGHGLIGVVKTLETLDRLEPGQNRFDTPVGSVGAVLEPDGSVTIRNVPARTHRLDVAIEVPEVGPVVGDIAWGGNWFFLTALSRPVLELENLEALLETTRRIRRTLDAQDLLDGEGVIDHVELFGPSHNAEVDSRNFVLCPGGQYDRSPCGTGTSAKLAVLHARGQLEIGRKWCQESITGGRFVGWLTEERDELIPHIQGRAWITGRGRLQFDPSDPFRAGFGGIRG